MEKREPIEQQVEESPRPKKETTPVTDDNFRRKRLEEITAVSDRIAISRLGILLNISPEETRIRAAAWAKQFNIRVSGEDLIFNPETLDVFITYLDTQFRK